MPSSRLARPFRAADMLADLPRAAAAAPPAPWANLARPFRAKASRHADKPRRSGGCGGGHSLRPANALLGANERGEETCQKTSQGNPS